MLTLFFLIYFYLWRLFCWSVIWLNFDWFGWRINWHHVGWLVGWLVSNNRRRRWPHTIIKVVSESMISMITTTMVVDEKINQIMISEMKLLFRESFLESWEIFSKSWETFLMKMNSLIQIFIIFFFLPLEVVVG